MWLGPAPERPYNPPRCLYHFRWFWDYSGGQMTNLGQHSLDIVDWCVGLGSLKSVSSAGGRFHLNDNGETPDTQDAIFEMRRLDGGVVAPRDAARADAAVRAGVLWHEGESGDFAAQVSDSAGRDRATDETIPQFTGEASEVATRRRLGRSQVSHERVDDRSGDQREQFREHAARNFLDCVKSRATPISDLESGHRVATACHLANISLRLGRKVRWDADARRLSAMRRRRGCWWGLSGAWDES